MTDRKPEPSSPMQIAAIARTDACDVDRLLRDLAQDLRKKGYRVGGAIRANERQSDRHPCDVVLEELTTGETVPLSEMRGPHAQGCQLDTAALARVAGLIEASLEGGLDLLIINKFGKREAEGSGLLEPVARAVEVGIPVIVTVSDDQTEAWQTFCGREGQILAAGRDAVDAWLGEALRDTRVSRTR